MEINNINNINFNAKISPSTEVLLKRIGERTNSKTAIATILRGMERINPDEYISTNITQNGLTRIFTANRKYPLYRETDTLLASANIKDQNYFENLLHQLKNFF